MSQVTWLFKMKFQLSAFSSWGKNNPGVMGVSLLPFTEDMQLPAY